MRIGFFGTPYLARRVLEDLIASSDIEVVFVVTNPDKPFGRDQIMQPSPVKELAVEHDIPVFQPEKVRKNKKFLQDIAAFECDYFIVVAYGKIMPREILESPKQMCINIHGSILPNYRGASPIQAALLTGEKETGVTIMRMSEGMDEGDILKIRTLAIAPDETSLTLFAKFADISGATLIQTLQELEHGGITPLPQDSGMATYCTKIEKEDGLVDWTLSAREIYQKWQAYTPWPGIYTMYAGKRLLLEKANYESGITNYELRPGEVIKTKTGEVGVICGEGILTLEQVKLEGKKSQNIRDFVNGNKIVGSRL